MEMTLKNCVPTKPKNTNEAFNQIVELIKNKQCPGTSDIVIDWVSGLRWREVNVEWGWEVEGWVQRQCGATFLKKDINLQQSNFLNKK